MINLEVSNVFQIQLDLTSLCINEMGLFQTKWTLFNFSTGSTEITEFVLDYFQLVVDLWRHCNSQDYHVVWELTNGKSSQAGKVKA